MSSRDESDGRYQIEFSTDKPGTLENALTGGLAGIASKGLDAVLGDEHGWYCKITDRVTELWESRWGATKGEAQQAAFHALKSKVDGFLVNQEREEVRQREAAKLRQSESRPREQQSSAGDNTGAELIGKIIGVVIVVGAIVWFVLAVAIPLLVINIATLALIAGITRKEARRFLLPLSVAGAVLVMVDYNRGWFTKTLAGNVSFFAGLIPSLLYLNILAGLIAAYFLIRDFLNERKPQEAGSGEFTQRNLITMSSLLLVGALTVGLQAHFGSPGGRFSDAILPSAPTSASAPARDNSSATGEPPVANANVNGKWRLVEGELHPVSKQLVQSSLTISGENGTRTATWISELDGSAEHNIQLTYARGDFVGDYYGGKGNVVIRPISGGRLSLTIDPYGEFAPIRNSIYANAQQDEPRAAFSSGAEAVDAGVTATSGSVAAITRIRAVFAEVQQVASRYRQTTHDLRGFYREGGQLVGHYDGAVLRKLAVQRSDEEWRGTEEYYFAEGQLVFIYVVRERREQSQRGPNHARLEYRFYFENGHLIRRIRTQLPSGSSEDLSSFDPRLSDLRTKGRLFAHCAEAKETDPRACTAPTQ